MRSAVLLLLVSLVAATGCGEDEQVKIGFVGGLSGRVADLGISGRNGAILAVEEQNSGGGIGGRTIRLLVKDDRQDADTARQADRELIEAGVEAIIGHMTSSMSVAALPVINKSETVMVRPTTTTTSLSGKDDYFLRISATADKYAAKMARHLYTNEKLRRVVVIYDLSNQAYTENWFNAFRKVYESLGGIVAAVKTYRSEPNTAFFEIVEAALVPDADGLILIASAMDGAMFSQQIRKTNREIKIAVAEWSSTEQLISLGGAAVEGNIVSQFFDRHSTEPSYVKFREHYRERFGNDPGFAAVASYDAANIVFESMRKRSGRETLKDAILRLGTFRGVQGPFALDEFGDAGRDTVLSTVRDGTFLTLE